MPLPDSTERKIVNVDVTVKKLDIESPVRNDAGLSDQLIHPRLAHVPRAVGIHVDAVRRGGGLTIDSNAKPYSPAIPGCAHDEIDIPRVKSVDDAATGILQRNGLCLDSPIARQCPLVEP